MVVQPDDPRIEFRPDPLVRQSDLNVHTEKEKRQHIITRAMVLILFGGQVLKSVSFVAGMLWWWPPW